MDEASILIILGFALTAFISLWALLQLWRFPASRTRNLALGILALIVLTAVLFLMSYGQSDGWGMMAVAVLPQVLAIWASGLMFHLVLFFRNMKSRPVRPFSVGLIYLPAIMLTGAIAAAAAVMPSVFAPGYETNFFHVHFGPLGYLFAVVGTIYQTGALIALGLVIRSGGRKLRRELGLTFFLIALAYLDAFLASSPLPGISYSWVSLFFQSLVGVALAYIVMRKSPLIVPDAEERVVKEQVTLLGPGATYLFLREKERARELFALYLKSGKEGLWITRRPPREARELYGLVKTPFIWLTSVAVDGENCIDPSEFGQLTSAVTLFIKKARECVMLIEGLEYITTKVGFPTVLKFIQYLNDRMMSTGGILMVGTTPQAFDEHSLALLKSEAAQVFEEKGWRDGSAEPQAASRGAEAA